MLIMESILNTRVQTVLFHMRSEFLSAYGLSSKYSETPSEGSAW